MKKNTKRRTTPMLVSLLLVFLLFTGCLDMETVVTVKKDGSGTVEQTMLMQSDILMMMRSMSEEGDASEFDLLKEDELKEQAERMGEGVRFVSAEPVKTETFEGYKAIYAFDDINSIRINQNPGELVPAPEEEEDDTIKEMITFSFEEGKPSTLTITFPIKTGETSSEDGEDTGGAATAMPDAGQIDMIKQLYQNMRLSMKLRIDGTIQETDASFRDGSDITLFELNFGEIFNNEKTMNTLINREPETIQEMKMLVEEAPGITAEMNETITVKYN